MHNLLPNHWLVSLNTIDLIVTFNEDTNYKNIFSYSKSSFVELESFYGIYDDVNFYDKLDLAEFIIFKNYISTSHNHYDSFINLNENFENKPFIVSRNLLITGYLLKVNNVIFKTLDLQINEHARYKINSKYDYNTLIQNTINYDKYFNSSLSNFCEVYNNTMLNNTIFELQVDSISVSNTIKKIIAMFNTLLVNHSEGKKPIKFLFLFSKYIYDNKSALSCSNDYKNEFIIYFINYLQVSNPNNKSSLNAIRIYEYINQYFSILCSTCTKTSKFLKNRTF